MAWPSTDAKTTKYLLPYPGNGSVANVPQDIKDLADSTETALTGKMDTAPGITTAAAMQKKIQVLPIASAPPTGGADGDIIFYV